jgi:hypothetical protein
VGAAAATATALGARGSGDVEPDCQWLGILEQQDMDSDLTKRRLSLARGVRLRSEDANCLLPEEIASLISASESPNYLRGALQGTSRSATRR